MSTQDTYAVKDSGERMTFDSGMVRDLTDGKIKWHLIRSGPMLKRWAVHLTKGAEKYGDDNWLKANGPDELKRFRESADRHFNQWTNGETDEDHAAAVIFNMNGAEYVKLRMAEIALAVNSTVGLRVEMPSEPRREMIYRDDKKSHFEGSLCAKFGCVPVVTGPCNGPKMPGRIPYECELLVSHVEHEAPSVSTRKW